MYDPERHGAWAIVEREDGRLGVEAVEGGSADPVVGSGQELLSPEFAAETHLRDYLKTNLGLIEQGLSLCTDSSGITGIEYVTPVGRIDILAVDAEQDFLVIELKVSRGPDEVAAQLLRYRSWVKRHIANGRRVRGAIIAGRISDKVRYALADVDDVMLYEYEMQLTVRRLAALPA